MPEPVIDSEKNACPIAVIHTEGFFNEFQSGMNKKAYPFTASGKKAMRIANAANKIKNSGIITLLVFSIVWAPNTIVSNVTAITTA